MASTLVFASYSGRVHIYLSEPLFANRAFMILQCAKKKNNYGSSGYYNNCLLDGLQPIRLVQPLSPDLSIMFFLHTTDYHFSLESFCVKVLQMWLGFSNPRHIHVPESPSWTSSPTCYLIKVAAECLFCSEAHRALNCYNCVHLSYRHIPIL